MARRSWVRGRMLDSGSFGKVHLAVDRSTGEQFAVKSAGGEECSSPGRNAQDVEALEDEIRILQELDCPQVVKYIGADWAWEGNMTVRNLLLEVCPGGSLAELLQTMGGRLEPSLLRKYVRDITFGLAYLHRSDVGIAHGDIKCHNILICQSGAKIADFGTAWKTRVTHGSDRGQSKAGVRGTVSYMSPETARQDPHQGTAVDIWSLGCTMIELATGKAPRSDLKKGGCAVMYAIGCSDDLPTIPSSLSPEAQDFPRLCLVRDPRTRATAPQLLAHPSLAEASVRREDDLPPTLVVGAKAAGSGFGRSMDPPSPKCPFEFSDLYEEECLSLAPSTPAPAPAPASAPLSPPRFQLKTPSLKRSLPSTFSSSEVSPPSKHSRKIQGTEESFGSIAFPSAGQWITVRSPRRI